MLLIGDIHITSTYVDRIVSSVREYIFSHPNEKSVVFLGDFVYHFNYDRRALLKVYDLFLDVYAQGRDVYVLAGNHDWITGEFVYAEGKKTFDVFGSVNHVGSSHVSKDGALIGSLSFITEPLLTQVDGQDVLFFPYHIPEVLPDSDTVFEEKGEADMFDELMFSKNQKEQWSGRANRLLRDMLKSRRSQKSHSHQLLLMHHWYIEGIAFPGQFAKFSYKSPALCSELLDMKDVLMVSGHLHQPFAYKNYMCLGSVRYTSPLEVNQMKYMGLLSVDPVSSSSQRDSLPLNSGKSNGFGDLVLRLQNICINPYIQIGKQDTGSGGEVVVTQFVIAKTVNDIVKQQETVFEDSEWNISYEYMQKNGDAASVFDEGAVNWKDRTVTIETNVPYEKLESIVENDVFETYKDVKIKKQSRSLSQIVELLDTESKELKTRIGDWKSLLREYIAAKYTADSAVYIEDLEEIGVM